MTKQIRYFYVSGWDELKPEQRDMLTKQAMEANQGEVVAGRDSKALSDESNEYEHLSDLALAIGDIEVEIEKWQIKPSLMASEATAIEKKVAELRLELTQLKQQFDASVHDTALAHSTGTPAPAADWRNEVRAEAWEKWVQTLAENGTPTLENVSVYLATWCKTNEIKTDMGNYPKPSYLKVHVIDAKHWEPPRNVTREAAKKHLEQKKQEKQAN